MDAVADYTEVRRALYNPTLPAYVSYVIHSHAGFDAVAGDETTTIVVRTSDGKVVAGKVPKISVRTGEHPGDDVVRHGPFDPACYAAAGATLTTFESRPAEAIALRALCAEKDSPDHTHDTAFRVLYADPATHRPLAVVGDTNEQYVKAHVDERFVKAGDYVVPSNFHVTIAGSGPMFWLNVDAHQEYSDYRFLTRRP